MTGTEDSRHSINLSDTNTKPFIHFCSESLGALIGSLRRILLLLLLLLLLLFYFPLRFTDH